MKVKRILFVFMALFLFMMTDKVYAQDQYVNIESVTADGEVVEPISQTDNYIIFDLSKYETFELKLKGDNLALDDFKYDISYEKVDPNYYYYSWTTETIIDNLTAEELNNSGFNIKKKAF